MWLKVKIHDSSITCKLSVVRVQGGTGIFHYCQPPNMHPLLRPPRSGEHLPQAIQGGAGLWRRKSLYTYRIYLIKRPGVYFRSKSLEGAFNPGGRLLLCPLQNSCTAAVIVLFLGCCLSLNLSHRSALCVGISLSAIDAS